MLKKIVILTSFLFLSFPTYSQSLVANIKENQEFRVAEETLIFLGHATSFWDSSLRTQAVTRELIRLGKKYETTILATAARHMIEDEGLSSLHYFNNSDVDLLIESRAGQHSLIAPQLKNIFIVGGNLGRCLCEGIRDLVSSFSESDQFSSVNIFLIRDGIYDSYPPFSPMRLEAVADFTQNFLIPTFNCPLQNWEIKKRVKAEDTALYLYYDEELIKTFDLEPDDKNSIDSLKKSIHLRFIESKDIEKYLSII